MEHPRGAAGPTSDPRRCAPGWESAAGEGGGEELGSAGLLLTTIVMVEGVLESQRGGLSGGSRSPEEFDTREESGHPAWMARSWGDPGPGLGPKAVSLS